MSKIATITGITGQDGAYLAALLLDKGYKVFGAYRRTSSLNLWRLEYLGVTNHPNFQMVEYDLTDMSAAFRLVQRTMPDELYNLASQSFVGVSFEQPVTSMDITGVGVLNLLEAVRMLKPDIRFYQASTSELYGLVQEVPQTEKTPFYPRSPYAIAKLCAHWMTINYRESYDLFASCGILFNHESPIRGIEFVTRKITDGVARIKLGKEKTLELGNLSAKRDWGYAKEYVEGMWRIMQAETPDVFVLATGRTETVRDFVSMSFKAADMNVVWEGEGEGEVGRCAKTGDVLVKVNPKFYRPAEVDLLIGSPAKAKEVLGWSPQTTLEELCSIMIKADLERVQNGRVF